MTTKQRTRGTTTREEVVAAALAVADEVGVDGLTIRAVAARAGIPAMSLYSHFSTKEELLDLMFDELARRLYADSGQPTWQAECHQLCHQIRRILLEHPRWTALLSRPVSAQQVPLRERVLALMTRDGIACTDAFQALYNVALVALGLTLTELSFKDAQGRSSIEHRFERLKQGIEQRTFGDAEPLTQVAVNAGASVKMSENFAATVQTFIKGLEAQRALI